ncbi:MAG: FHA domain-containing protein [Clostridia bacterium]|nr:FHA domain-containing protein [Clostridia bacterium]
MARKDFGSTTNFEDNFKTVAPENLEPTPAAPTEPENYSPTVPMPESTVESFSSTLSDDQVSEGERRVVGWLICTKGTVIGKDFRLHSEFNYIGRDYAQDVCIPDPKVSEKSMAWICYDRIGREFTIGRGDHPSNVTRVNGKPLYSPQPLQMYDRILLGDTELMFMPLCSAEFTWEEDQ